MDRLHYTTQGQMPSGSDVLSSARPEIFRPFDSLGDLGRATSDLKRIQAAIQEAGTPMVDQLQRPRRPHWLASY